MDALLNENQQLKEMLLMNENAIQFIEKYTKQFSNIYDKAIQLIDTSQNLEKQVVIRDNAIQHVKNILDTLYNDNIAYESKFGAMIVNEIKNKGEHFIMELSGCLCKKNSSMIMFEAPLMIEHQIESPHQDVDNIIELIEELKVDELKEENENENDDENDENSSQVEVIEIPESRVTTKSFDETFLENMQEQFLEYANRKHKKTISKILENKKVEDKELVRLIDSFNKAHPELKNKIKKYEKQRNNKEEHAKEILKAIYNEKYGDKYKRKTMDQTNFENPHFEKWIKKNMPAIMDGGDGMKRGREEEWDVAIGMNRPSPTSRTLLNVPANLEESNKLSNFSRYLAFNHLLETIDLFDISSESLNDLYTDMGTIPYKDMYGRMIINGMLGGAKPILENSQFEEHYDTIRLLTDMKHDFSHNKSFQKVFKAIPAFFKQGIMSEPLFMAKVISTKYDFYQNLYVRDATRAKYMKRGENRKPFDKAELGTIKKIVCDMPLGAEYHVDSEDNTRLQRIYTYGNHLDPSPVTGRVTELYTILHEKDIVKTLNEIIERFFMSCFKVIDPSNQKQEKYRDLIPKINKIRPNDDENKYRYEFVGNPEQLLSGTDFEINKIANLIPPLTQEGLNKYNSFSPEAKLLYKMTFKELGDHIQLHELKNMRIQYEEKTKDIIFGTRDQILIADAFKQSEPILFWFDSVTNKFDPGAKLPTLGSEEIMTPLTGKDSYKSMLFYYSTEHKQLIDYSKHAVMKSLVENKLNKYTSIIQNTKFGREDKILNIQNIIRETKERTFPIIFDETQFEYYYKQIIQIIKELYYTEFPLDIEGILKKMDPLIQLSILALNVKEKINNFVRLIQSALRITDISFETIFQYGTITQEIDHFKINRTVDFKLLIRDVGNFKIAKESRSTPKRVEDIFSKLKSMRKHAYNIIPTSEKYKKHLQTIFETLMGLDKDVLTIHSLISNTVTWIQESDKFGSIQMLTKLDEDISHIQELIQTNETLKKRYYEEEPFEITIPLAEVIPEKTPTMERPMSPESPPQPQPQLPPQPQLQPPPQPELPEPVTEPFSITNLFPNFKNYDDYFKQLLLIDLFPQFQEASHKRYMEHLETMKRQSFELGQ